MLIIYWYIFLVRQIIRLLETNLLRSIQVQRETSKCTIIYLHMAQLLIINGIHLGLFYEYIFHFNQTRNPENFLWFRHLYAIKHQCWYNCRKVI